MKPFHMVMIIFGKQLNVAVLQASKLILGRKAYRIPSPSAVWHLLRTPPLFCLFIFYLKAYWLQTVMQLNFYWKSNGKLLNGSKFVL